MYKIYIKMLDGLVNTKCCINLNSLVFHYGTYIQSFKKCLRKHIFKTILGISVHSKKLGRGDNSLHNCIHLIFFPYTSEFCNFA